MKKLLNQIAAMDKKSDEFCELYHSVSEKYFDFDKPDEFQAAAALLHLVLNRGEPWMVEMMVRLANELNAMVDQKSAARHGSFAVKDGKEIFFDFYTEKSALASLSKAVRNTVMVKTKELESDMNSKERE